MSANSEASTTVTNLSAAVPTDTAILYTVFPGTNKRTGWNITMAGPGHAKTIAASNEAARKQLQRSDDIEKAQVNGRKWKGDVRQPDEARREFVEALVARIVTWTPVDFGDGPLEFSDAKAVEALLNPKLASYAVQLNEFLLDERSFIVASAIN